jgi:hypothetical protein
MRKASKKKAALEEAAEDKAALEEIARIRRNGFNPGEDLVKKCILTHGPKRALAVMQLAAAYDRSIEEVH